MGVQFVTSAALPTEFGLFTLHVFTDGNQEHLAITHGKFPLIESTEAVMARVHSECLTGDGLFSLRCDCGPQLAHALATIGQAEHGVVIYLRQEGRGIGLVEKIKAYALQDSGEDTVSANIKLGHPIDARSYHMVGPILKHLGVSKVRLMTNNPTKISALTEDGIEVVERIAIKPLSNIYNQGYLKTKAEIMNHLD